MKLRSSVKLRRVDRPAGFRAGEEDIAPTMDTAVDTEMDLEGQMSCFYRGEEQVMLVEPCDTRGTNMCVSCIEDMGGLCTCMLADNTEVAVDRFTHDFQESAEQIVQQGAERVQQQDETMLSA